MIGYKRKCQYEFVAKILSYKPSISSYFIYTLNLKLYNNRKCLCQREIIAGQQVKIVRGQCLNWRSGIFLDQRTGVLLFSFLINTTFTILISIINKYDESDRKTKRLCNQADFCRRLKYMHCLRYRITKEVSGWYQRNRSQTIVRKLDTRWKQEIFSS